MRTKTGTIPVTITKTTVHNWWWIKLRVKNIIRAHRIFSLHPCVCVRERVCIWMRLWTSCWHIHHKMNAIWKLRVSLRVCTLTSCYPFDRHPSGIQFPFWSDVNFISLKCLALFLPTSYSVPHRARAIILHPFSIFNSESTLLIEFLCVVRKLIFVTAKFSSFDFHSTSITMITCVAIANGI